MKGNMISRYVTTGVAAVGICIAAGCATRDTVSHRFHLLEENINSAKTAGAETYAPSPLKSAEAKLGAARSAVRANDMVSAERFVDEAMVDADYARAVAPTEKARIDARELRKAIQAVRDEVKRIQAEK